jgi:hypothetical protein
MRLCPIARLDPQLLPYVDTLVSLEPGEKEVAVKRKKATASKVGKATRAVKK